MNMSIRRPEPSELHTLINRMAGELRFLSKLIRGYGLESIVGTNDAITYAANADDMLTQLEGVPTESMTAMRCALAALTQNKTFPADIELAKRVLLDAIARAEGRE